MCSIFCQFIQIQNCFCLWLSQDLTHLPTGDFRLIQSWLLLTILIWIGHVCSLPLLGARFNLTCCLAVPPPYLPYATQEESHNYKFFWKNDNICFYIISGWLSAKIFNLLSPAYTKLFNFPIYTACDLLYFF